MSTVEAAHAAGSDGTGSNSYPGGKSGAGVYQRLINEIPPHVDLVVPFAGRCGITRRIKAAPGCTVLIDRDPDVLAWWDRWQRSPAGRPVELIEADGIEWLRHHFGLDRFGLGRSGTASPHSATPPAVPHNPAARDWGAGDAGSGDGRSRAFVFLDPPYVIGERACGRIYRHELEDADHVRLVDVFARLPVPAMLCGYASPLYASLEKFRKLRHEVPTRGGLQTEFVWFNYSTPTRLHDHRFVGDDRRERERVRRRQRNMLGLIRSLPPRERAAMLEAIADEFGGESL